MWGYVFDFCLNWLRCSRGVLIQNFWVRIFQKESSFDIVKPKTIGNESVNWVQDILEFVSGRKNLESLKTCLNLSWKPLKKWTMTKFRRAQWIANDRTTHWRRFNLLSQLTGHCHANQQLEKRPDNSSCSNSQLQILIGVFIVFNILRLQYCKRSDYVIALIVSGLELFLTMSTFANF